MGVWGQQKSTSQRISRGGHSGETLGVAGGWGAGGQWESGLARPHSAPFDEEVDHSTDFADVEGVAAHISIEVIRRHHLGAIVVESSPRGFSNVLWRPHVLPYPCDS